MTKELLAQGPEFAGDNISLIQGVDSVTIATDAIRRFWKARVKNDSLAMQKAREVLTEVGGTTPEVMRRANQMLIPVTESRDSVIQETSLEDQHFKAMQDGDEDRMNAIEAEMFA